MSTGSEFDAFLDAARDEGCPDAVDVQRIDTALAKRITWDAPVPTPVAAALRCEAMTPAGRPWAALRTRLLKVIGVAAPVMAIGFVLQSRLSAVTAPTPSTRSDDAGSAEVKHPASGEATSADAVPSAPSIAIVDLPEAPSVGGAAVPKTVGNTQRAGTLEAEVALLSEVSSALRRQEPARALELVDRHARVFPIGVLRPEFNAQRVVALATLGRREEACAAAARFLESYPQSPLAPQVRASCEGEVRDEAAAHCRRRRRHRGDELRSVRRRHRAGR